MCVWVCVCMCTCSYGYYLVGPCVDVFICIPTSRERYCESGKACVRLRERKFSRLSVGKRASRRLEKCVASVRKMRRVGPSQDDVDSAHRIRLRPSCDVKIRYHDARLLREVSKRW
jgi:hypothetical protein